MYSLFIPFLKLNLFSFRNLLLTPEFFILDNFSPKILPSPSQTFFHCMRAFLVFILPSLPLVKVYDSLAVPTLTYGCENWPMKTSDKRRITSAEMRFMRRTTGVTLNDRIRSEEITQHTDPPPVMQR